MAKLLWINVILILLLSFAAYADGDRESWKKKSFQNTLEGFINKEEEINKYDVLAWYVSTKKKEIIGEHASVLVEATNSNGSLIYYLAILYLDHRKNRLNEWKLVWIFDDDLPPKVKRYLKKPNNENIYSLFSEAHWNWGCENIRVDVEGKVRTRIWEEIIGEKPTKDFVDDKQLVCSRL